MSCEEKVAEGEGLVAAGQGPSFERKLSMMPKGARLTAEELKLYYSGMRLLRHGGSGPTRGRSWAPDDVREADLLPRQNRVEGGLTLRALLDKGLRKSGPSGSSQLN